LDRVQVSHFLFACACPNFRFVHHIDAYRQAAARAARLVSHAPLSTSSTTQVGQDQRHFRGTWAHDWRP
jgi:hypothetical protein